MAPPTMPDMPPSATGPRIRLFLIHRVLAVVRRGLADWSGDERRGLAVVGGGRGAAGGALERLRGVAARGVFLQVLDDRAAEDRNVARQARGDQVAVAHHAFVDVVRPGVDDVVLDEADAGHAPALGDAGGGEHPAGVADGGDQAAALV